jgi:hypothetical protein
MNVEVWKSEKHFLLLHSLFDLPAIASRSGEAGGYSIFKVGFATAPTRIKRAQWPALLSNSKLEYRLIL